MFKLIFISMAMIFSASAVKAQEKVLYCSTYSGYVTKQIDSRYASDSRGQLHEVFVRQLKAQYGEVRLESREKGCRYEHQDDFQTEFRKGKVVEMGDLKKHTFYSYCRAYVKLAKETLFYTEIFEIAGVATDEEVYKRRDLFRTAQEKSAGPASTVGAECDHYETREAASKSLKGRLHSEAFSDRSGEPIDWNGTPVKVAYSGELTGDVAAKTPPPPKSSPRPALEVTKDDSLEKFAKENRENSRDALAKGKARTKAAADKGDAEQAKRDARFQKEKAAAANRAGTASKQ